MTQAKLAVQDSDIRYSEVVLPSDLEVGTDFSARQFRHSSFDGLMDPLIMVDDYTMTGPTFGAHPHAGLSAVTLLFEESRGDFFNHDSLDNHLVLEPGDLYWVSAGRGVMHDESPENEEARIRGLQIFVKLPASQSAIAPEAVFVPGTTMPTITAPGVRVRVATGASNGKQSQAEVPNALTMLDGYLDGGAHFTHETKAGESVWVYPVEGEVTVTIDGTRHRVQGGRALALSTGEDPRAVQLEAVRNTHFVLIAAPPLKESFVQEGPFALADKQQIAQARADAEAGRMGQVVRKPVTNR